MKIINPVNNFSGNRFLHVLKCGFLSPEFRLCVMSMAVMYMIFFFVKLFDFALVYEMLDELSDFTFLTMVFGITFGASFFAASLSDKPHKPHNASRHKYGKIPCPSHNSGMRHDCGFVYYLSCALPFTRYHTLDFGRHSCRCEI